MSNEDQSTLQRIKIEALREHFRTTYRLKEEQVDLMLKSSANSLNKSLSALYEALETDDNFAELSKLGHSIKGLLLNMGVESWAELARELEVTAAEEKKCNYRILVERLHEAVKDVLREYSQNSVSDR